jgi:hypothetical protein
MTLFGGKSRRTSTRSGSRHWRGQLNPKVKLMEHPIKQCSQCHQPFEEWDRGEVICFDCRQLRLFNKLPPEVQREIDDLIYARRILEGIFTLNRWTKLGLGDGNWLYSWRYSVLRRIAPKEFSVSYEGYWKGFYS